MTRTFRTAGRCRWVLLLALLPLLGCDGQVLRGYSRAGYEKAIRAIRG